MYSQYISKHFKLDNDIWYFNQEMEIISISMAVVVPFDILGTIGYIAKFYLCFDNNFYCIGDHIICIQYVNIVFFIISVIKSIYKNVKASFHSRFTNFNNKHNNSNVKTQTTSLDFSTELIRIEKHKLGYF